MNLIFFFLKLLIQDIAGQLERCARVTARPKADETQLALPSFMQKIPCVVQRMLVFPSGTTLRGPSFIPLRVKNQAQTDRLPPELLL